MFVGVYVLYVLECGLSWCIWGADGTPYGRGGVMEYSVRRTEYVASSLVGQKVKITVRLVYQIIIVIHSLVDCLSVLGLHLC